MNGFFRFYLFVWFSSLRYLATAKSSHRYVRIGIMEKMVKGTLVISITLVIFNNSTVENSSFFFFL